MKTTRQLLDKGNIYGTHHLSCFHFVCFAIRLHQATSLLKCGVRASSYIDLSILKCAPHGFMPLIHDDILPSFAILHLSSLVARFPFQSPNIDRSAQVHQEKQVKTAGYISQTPSETYKSPPTP